MSDDIRQLLTGAGSILDFYPEPFSTLREDLLLARGSVEESLRGDLRRVEHDFRRALDRLRSRPNGQVSDEPGLAIAGR